MRAFFEGLLLLILVLIAVTARAEEVPSLVFYDYSELKPGPFKVKDLFHQGDIEENGKDIILETKLGEAPPPNGTIKFTNRAISLAIARQIAKVKDPQRKEYLQSVKIQIPNEITVRGQGWEASQKTLEIDLDIQINRFCGGKCEVEITELKKPTYKEFYGKEARAELIELKTPPRGAFNFPVRILRKSNVIDHAWIQGSARITQEVPVAKKLLNAGWRLTDEDYEVRRMDVTMASDTPANKNILVGSKLARTLNPNQVILNSAIVRETDVAFGQNIKAIIQDSDWQVSVDAVARDSGSVGDRIKVYNPATKRTLTGVLISKGVVEIK